MKAILLDMYGVILRQTGDDFAPYVRRIFPDLTTEQIYVPWLKADVGEIDSLQIWRELGFTGDLEKTQRDYLDTLELNDGFLDFIEAVRGRYKLAIISNDSSGWSRYIRQRLDINKYFDVISISGDLKIQKPDKRIFQLTTDRLVVHAEDCVYVDDREQNLYAAEALGMTAVMLNSRGVDYDGTCFNTFEELKNSLL